MYLYNDDDDGDDDFCMSVIYVCAPNSVIIFEALHSNTSYHIHIIYIYIRPREEYIVSLFVLYCYDFEPHSHGGDRRDDCLHGGEK